MIIVDTLHSSIVFVMYLVVSLIYLFVSQDTLNIVWSQDHIGGTDACARTEFLVYRYEQEREDNRSYQ